MKSILKSHKNNLTKMPLKLYIESSISVIPALRAGLVQINRSEQRQTGALWALKTQFLLQAAGTSLLRPPKEQGDVTHKAAEGLAVLAQGWL